MVFVLSACETGTPTPKPTKTPIMSGPLATAQALNAMVTLNPSKNEEEIIAEDDYVGIFIQAWEIVRDNYVRDNYNGVDWDAVYDEYLPKFEAVTTQEEHWELMGDLIHELGDDHSRFVPPSNMEAEFGVDTSDSSGPVATTGIFFWPGPSREDEWLTIWDVCTGSPAANEGIEIGDIIMAVNDVPVVKENGDFDSALFTRPASYGTNGGDVKLTIQQEPDGDPVDFVLAPGSVLSCRDWSYGIVSTNPRIGYILIPDFDGDSDTIILEMINDMEEKTPLDGLILDVRHNPGGNSDRSMAIFTQGIIGTVGAIRSDSSRTIYRIRGPVKWNEETPLVVLTDGSSHSAADYFPAGLQELGRATIIGTNSAGNTEGIISFNLADHTLIRLAVSALLLEDGSSIEGVGVTPDVYVPLGQWGLKQKPYDAQLQAAIDYLSQ